MERGQMLEPKETAKALSATSSGYYSDHVDQNEQVRLLNRLANAEGSSQVKQDAVLANPPDWKTLEKAGVLPAGLSAVLSKINPLCLDEFAEMLAADPDLVRALVALVRLEGNLHTVQYVLTVLCEVVRDDSSKYEALCSAVADSEVFEAFRQLLEVANLDSYTADRAAFLLSGLMCRARSGTFSDSQVEYLVQGLLHGRAANKFLLSEGGRLDAFVNLLKIDGYRPMIWDCRGFPELVLRNLSLTLPASVLYKAMFCVWLLTFHDAFLPQLNEKGIVVAVCVVLKESRVEKVIRVGLGVLHNLLKCDASVETVIEQNVAQVLALLEFEKWRDGDMYDDIRLATSHLEQKIRQFNNFDRYCHELDKGQLTFSVLHSEKFWRENVMAFENDEFRAIKKLVKLLDTSTDKTTLAVACYDLGEFARLHPAGKKVCQQLKVKDRVMLMISDKDREVAGEALLCIQKLMLNNWQDVAELGK
ncbi:vacuolar ATP synthase subunit 54kD, putative [Toxoplasma gondii ME49]|uniref:V-type proton ATPase subunit H n=12 Tax=Toxoplasma gondii TaxID=5811 RepID=A0A125YWH2_TOXGV|nr:vacuolar ATP synthase subunit 54kD, putative [Toxoplasma gondii ME49]EPR57971.1 putative vacuolar ATP synthase subunit 54kD [Toxoplasma gondii GT1]ESS29414.1 putative vacuolar ATP synthase subunit 54kD [Toxoplasma gondii VEG]KAF4645955.1 putative vacuolar ATP synthase subunit 54kD [Toxoplasma gondii]KFG34993.1 putative vacuolar ATP synthase subunit 54kD [Toxoplasma gondii GAB2-2007-GAL-DOM2]KFG49483.1 putative vacuolar ATP synthase subunit 54kD [Toxoplasma gondii FOU]KFG60582.1 putative va|eukprot:XP_018638479.1 vacuolar ATP synthase subunit 54kD, putative [Toxoplasma gondii ME49]